MVTEDTDSVPEKQNEEPPPIPLPKVVGFGIETVFQLVAESHTKHPHMCIKALEALLNLLEGQHPQGLKNENQSVLGELIADSKACFTHEPRQSFLLIFVDSLFAILLQLSDCTPSDLPTTSKMFSKPPALTAVATSCLISLAVARGDTKQLLQAIVSLLKCDELFVFQELKVICPFSILKKLLKELF